MNDKNEAERIVHGEAAEQALSRFLRPAFDQCRASYLKSLAEVAAKPLGKRERAAIEKLAVALKVIDVVESQITAIVGDGKSALSDRRAADQITQLPTEQQRWVLW